MPSESVRLQPLLGDLSVGFGAAGEEADLVALVIPLVDLIDHALEDLAGRHAFGLFVGHVLADRAVDVDEEVLASLWQSWRDWETSFIHLPDEVDHGRPRTAMGS